MHPFADRQRAVQNRVRCRARHGCQPVSDFDHIVQRQRAVRRVGTHDQRHINAGRSVERRLYDGQAAVNLADGGSGAADKVKIGRYVEREAERAGRIDQPRIGDGRGKGVISCGVALDDRERRRTADRQPRERAGSRLGAHRVGRQGKQLRQRQGSGQPRTFLDRRRPRLRPQPIRRQLHAHRADGRRLRLHRQPVRCQLRAHRADGSRLRLCLRL